MKDLEFNFFNDIEEYNINNFIIYNENIEAFYYLNQDINDVKDNIIFLSGFKKSGKTYLSNIWKQKNNAKYIDNEIFDYDFNKFIIEISNKIEIFDYYLIDNFNKNVDEQKLLFLINYIIQKNSKLLIISDFEFNKIKIKLKDLKSRINSSVFLKIKKLPKEIKPMFIVKLFNDKKLKINPSILKFLLSKLSNNYDDICNFIGEIKNNLDNTNENLTVDFIKKIIIKSKK